MTGIVSFRLRIAALVIGAEIGVNWQQAVSGQALPGAATIPSWVSH
ncbi:hypothetical protein [Microbacterium sp. CFBP 8794]|nr:hypothetical protein [Microbacterium sp. CFBP 8794]MBD8476917.1 hypothetical protein [Microbacterium sp. CFBP 8794]